MARVPLISNRSTDSSIFFHEKAYGQNIRLYDNASTATRHTSFDHGITFTNRRINMNERIYMKITDFDINGQWLGSIAIGFTQLAPDSIQRRELCKSALPTICSKTAVSYLKRIAERLTKDTIITFYFNQEGAFYLLDGREQEISRNIDVSKPLWGVIDLYGNVRSISFISSAATVEDSRAFFMKYNQSPDKLPIRYFTNLRSEDLQFCVFHEAHGKELDLYCEDRIAFRKNVQKLARPYVFIDFPMKPGDEFYMRILSIDCNYRTAGVLGFTNANLSLFVDNFNLLPANDPIALYDREEFWILDEEAFDERLNELDEYRFVYDNSGNINMCRNNELPMGTKTVACADPSQSFYPFLFLNGRIKAFYLIGLISSTRKTPFCRRLSSTQDDANLCSICFENPLNCVLFPCGHLFFCSNCKDNYERRSGKVCPVCRASYTEVFEIEDS